jgi:hypothetical protein
LRDMLRKIAKADTLHDSRDEIALCLLVLAHKAVDCSRERKGMRGGGSVGRRYLR